MTTANQSNDLFERLSSGNGEQFATIKSRLGSIPVTKGSTPDPDPKNTWLIMTNLPGKIQLIVAQLYSLRTWIEYGFKQVKNELGWADFRLTDYASIERWWELVFSSYLLVSLQANSFQSEASNSHSCLEESSPSLQSSLAQFSQHPWWEPGTTWKSALNKQEVNYSTLHLLLFNLSLVPGV